MERSEGRSVRPVPVFRSVGSEALADRAATGKEIRTAALVLLLVGEAAAFAALVASGNMPGIVTMLYRALLTL